MGEGDSNSSSPVSIENWTMCLKFPSKLKQMTTHISNWKPLQASTRKNPSRVIPDLASMSNNIETEHAT